LRKPEALHNRLYTGWFQWNGKLYQGRHEPLVSAELWERAQAVMDGRLAKKDRRVTHHFAFSGLIACAKCGCSVVFPDNCAAADEHQIGPDRGCQHRYHIPFSYT
jgi:hypothetical protein